MKCRILPVCCLLFTSLIVVSGCGSGGGLVESTNYSLKVTVGGSPMGTASGGTNSATVGVGALVNQ